MRDSKSMYAQLLADSVSLYIRSVIMEDNNPSLYSIKSVCQLEEDEFEAVFEFDSDSDTPIGLRFNRLTSSFLIQ